MNTATTELQNLYELNRQHLSDLRFFEDEAKFIRKILDKFFLPMLSEYNMNRAKMISLELKQLKMVKANMVNDVLQHQANLEATIRDVSGKSIDFLRLEGSRMVDEIRELNKRFRNIKKGVHGIYKALEVTAPAPGTPQRHSA